MAYLRKGQPAYVVIAVTLSDDNIFYHCAGAALSMDNAIRYAEYYEQNLREGGFDLNTVDDELDRASYYESIWDGADGSQAFVKIQKSALME